MAAAALGWVTPDYVITGNRLLAICHEAGIPYVKTDYLGEVDLAGARVLVTHNGGFNIRDGPHGTLAITSPQNRHNNAMAAFVRLPPGVHWYAQNADADRAALHGLPLGVDNFEIPPGLEGNRHFTAPPDGSTAGRLVCERIGQRLPIRNRVYLRLRVDTAPYERGYCLHALRDAPWVTHEEQRVPQVTFLRRLLEHEFVLCPEGNGIDTHRVWEALYLGCWPIVKRSRAMEEFAGLPILFVDEWDDVKQWELDAHLHRVERGEFSMDKARLGHWREKLCQMSAL
jgi:hypothetical protein